MRWDAHSVLIEDELHVILKCHMYIDLRKPLLDCIATRIEPNIGNEENLLYLILSNEHTTYSLFFLEFPLSL